MLETCWKKIKRQNFKVGNKINIKKGTIYYRKQFKNLSRIDLSKKIYPLDLFNIIRAKMFDPYKSAYFIHKNKKYFIKVFIKK